MSAIWKAGDIVTIAQLPINWGTQEQLKELLGKDFRIEAVDKDGSIVVSLGKKYRFGNEEIDRLVVHHSWVNAQLTIEEIK